MFRNYLAAALRNLVRNRLYAAITIAGLAIGFAAAILLGLFVREELSYESFIPGSQHVYRVTQTITLMGNPPVEVAATPMMLAKPFRQDFSEVAYAARLVPSLSPPVVKTGQIVSVEQNLLWADPDFFRVMPLPTLAGDLASALVAPDSLVLTRSAARKYFGRDAPLGQTLQVDGAPMTVKAVIEDLPSNTELVADIFASALSASSPISKYEAIVGPTSNVVATYVRLRPTASLQAIEPRLDAFLRTRLPIPAAQASGIERVMHLTPVRDVHLQSKLQGTSKPPSDPGVIIAIGVIAVLIVVVAAINFVTLMTARASRRAVEVGVRKASGARRRDLIAQFMGEALLYVAASAVLAVALAEVLLPAVNAGLRRELTFSLVREPGLIVLLVGVVAVTAALAGAYPALVMSAFRPAAVLKGETAAGGGGPMRHLLVVGQFAVLIALVLVALTIARQTVFALNHGSRIDKDQVLLITASPCNEAFRDEAARLPGVRAASCASLFALNLGDSRETVTAGGRRTDLATTPVDFNFFKVLGVQPLAGRLFDRSRPADGGFGSDDANPPVVLNESAVRRLGFHSHDEAIGKSVVWRNNWKSALPEAGEALVAKPSQVVGVVPDFTLGSVRQPISPTLYVVGPNAGPSSAGLVIKLDPVGVQRTLTEIDRVWTRYAGPAPIQRVFIDRFTLRLYADAITQGAAVAAAALVAVVIASLGLFGLAAFTTERRTKEIGVRKAMGADAGDVVRMLLWDFSKPILAANLVAWPVAFLVSARWLEGFAYHVDAAWWPYLAVGAGSIAIACGTVIAHTLSVARARPVSALRYE